MGKRSRSNFDRERRGQRRARVPMCWLCDRKLNAGGYEWVGIVENGHQYPAHKRCAERAGVTILTQAEAMEV